MREAWLSASLTMRSPGAGEGGERPDVRRVAAGEREGVLGPEPGGERTLEAAVLVTLAGDQPRGSRARGGHRRGKRAEAEVVVRAERERRGAHGLCRAAAKPLLLELFELLGEVGEGIRAHVFHVKRPP